MHQTDEGLITGNWSEDCLAGGEERCRKSSLPEPCGLARPRLALRLWRIRRVNQAELERVGRDGGKVFERHVSELPAAAEGSEDRIRAQLNPAACALIATGCPLWRA